MQHARLRVDRLLNILTSENGETTQEQTDKEKGKWFLYLYNSKQKLRSFCLIVSLVHLLIAVGYIILFTAPFNITITKLQTHTTQSIGAWLMPSATTDVNTTGLVNLLDLQKCPLASSIPSRSSKYVIQQTILEGPGEIDTRGLIIAFHVLSWLFQFISAYDDTYYTEMEAGRTNLGHFFEYSISASIMLIAICVQLGITDIYLITAITGNCAACMLFGAIAELLSNYPIAFYLRLPFTTNAYRFSAHWVAHFAGWGTITIAYLCASSNLMIFERCVSPNATTKMPEIIRFLIVVEGVLFMCFGFVQIYAFIARQYEDSKAEKNTEYNPKKRKQEIAYTTEFWYILLSLTAKTALGVFIMAGNSKFGKDT